MEYTFLEKAENVLDWPSRYLNQGFLALGISHCYFQESKLILVIIQIEGSLYWFCRLQNWIQRHNGPFRECDLFIPTTEETSAGMRHIICRDNEIGWFLLNIILAVTSRGIMQISKGNQRTECDIHCGNQMGNLLPKFPSLQGDGFFCQ